MDSSFTLGLLNVVIAALGVLFLVVSIYEYTKLRELRKDFDNFKQSFHKEFHLKQKAIQRVISSYQIPGTDQQISLLKSAVEIDPYVFNGYNSLGYAYLAAGDTLKAIDAFREAIYRHPEDKAGYFDLAYAYLQVGSNDLCLDYLERAVQADSTSIEDLRENLQFRAIWKDPRYQKLAGEGV